MSPKCLLCASPEQVAGGTAMGKIQPHPQASSPLGGKKHTSISPAEVLGALKLHRRGSGAGDVA